MPFDNRSLSRRQAIRLLGAGAAGGVGALLHQPFAFAQGPTWVSARRGAAVKFSSGAIIRTVLKDVKPDELAGGGTMFHEHVAFNYYSPPPAPPQSAGGSPSARPAPPPLSSQLDLMAEEMRQAAFDGLAGIVDANANGNSVARTDAQIDFLRQLATRVPKLNIIVAGGPFKAQYSPEIVRMSADELTEQLVRDALRQRWGAFGEIGTSMEMTADERKVLTAIARAHVRTGVPIFTHTDHEGCPSCALAQLDLMEKEGVDPKHLVIGHLADIKPGSEPVGQTAKAIAKRGAFIGFDTVGHQMVASMNPEAGKVKLVLEVLNAGYEDHLMLSADFTQSPQLKANWGNGFSTVLVQFVPKLKYAGVKDETLHKILVDNPRRFLAFVPKATS
jgi:phosphotriesterase-related protein